jgi:hypothetical protein
VCCNDVLPWVSQDQERDLLQRGFEALQTLELERVAQMSQAGQALASSYSSALSGLPAAAEELKGMVAMLGGGGEAGLAHLAQVAAGRAAQCGCQRHRAGMISTAAALPDRMQPKPRQCRECLQAWLVSV